ncbi:hypothetical protein GN244_ATG08700 [Phytophthora infestans]|uniref:Uncharacterized protein n=1 Tax=Phytophthora infestans TaxID=4787 RepID=A0A833T8F6_PHYIN|nr:hypothetical protein GN244_ATG08700 [Phytophthora infestans]
MARTKTHSQPSRASQVSRCAYPLRDKATRKERLCDKRLSYEGFRTQIIGHLQGTGKVWKKEMYDVYGSSGDRWDEDRLAEMEHWLRIIAKRIGACLEEDGGNDDDSAVSTPTCVTPDERLPAPVEPAATSPPQTAGDPPSSNEPSAESEPTADFAPKSEPAVTEPAVAEPAVAEPPESKRRVTKRGAPAKKATKKAPSLYLQQRETEPEIKHRTLLHSHIESHCLSAGTNNMI